MRNYKIIVQYDGGRYSGWQVQKTTPDTIQGKIETVLGYLFNHPIEIAGSGRTDAGVHALGQVANFHLSEEDIALVIKDKNDTLEGIICSYLNAHLPKDIAIVSVTEVDERFHSRLSAKSKTYVYRIHTSDISNVFERKYVYDYPEKLDVSLMRKAASYLEGTHDFKSFCANRHMKKSTVRTIYSIEITETDSELVLSFTGNGFLMNMVRILTGTLIEVGSKRRDPASMPEILDALDRDAAGYTAPPQGLFLKEVYY